MQWALSSDQIDMAIICKEAAGSFIKYDDNFEIVAPVVKNSDVFLLKEHNPKTIGVIQNRNYQTELVNQYYKNSKAVPLINSALMYVLENNTVEGVVIDSIKALSLKGKKVSTTTDGEYNTYVLVVNRSFKNTELYNRFIKLYNESVQELDDEKILKKELERYTGNVLSKEDMGEIKEWKLKFLQLNQ